MKASKFVSKVFIDRLEDYFNNNAFKKAFKKFY